jgi:hypothetical protein
VNWDAVGALGEIFGGLAVLITLIYLAATDSDLRQTLMKAGELSDDERERVYNFAMMF